MIILYKWTVLPLRLDEVPPAMGIAGNLKDAQDAAAPLIVSGRAFLAEIDQVVLATGLDLAACYVPCGWFWLGRKTRAGRVKWFVR